MNAEKLSAPTPPVGVIESLSAGFEIVAGRLALVLLPLLVDLLLWTGPRLSLRPAIENYYHNIWEPTLSNLDADTQQTFAGVSDMLVTAAEEVPVLYLPLVAIPTVMGGRAASPLPFAYNPPLWEVQNPLGLVGVNLASLLASVLIGAIYLALIADQVRSGAIRLKHLAARLPVNVLWLVIFGMAVPVLLLIVYLPFVILAAGFSLISPFLALMVDWGGRLLVLWIVLFLVFTVHGLFMNDRGLLGALWDSIRVVQWNMSSTILLIALIILLNVALSYVWNMAPAGSWLALVAIAGNAVVNTGLIAATFVYYKDRYRYWREVRAELLAELERRRAQQGR